MFWPGVCVAQCRGGDPDLGKERPLGGAGMGNSVVLEPLASAQPLHPTPPTIYPVGPHVSLEAAQFVVSDAPSHHNLRTFVVLFMAVLGQGRDGVLGILQLHIHQQGVGHLVIETLQGREVQLQNSWVTLGTQWEAHSQSGVLGPTLYRRNRRLRRVK